ncbi:GtrA family protein [Streptomyces sp. V3I7]|uniref:GtrA family protein n=1 Tax=Streptomyces sp. V3I7 TaxID=3042278 RepID=UPI002788605A|nr:GtrA family protein [Streptomyces sp. V3I7]MDQ0991239.1 putative flippase GtrA [Streptomyces sp. V3I7]
MTVNLAEPPPAPGVAPPASPPARVRPLARVVLEVVKFGVVGGSGVLVNFLVFNLLLHGLGWRATTATVPASCLAMTTNYLGFRFFAYRDRVCRTRRQIALFFGLSGLGVALESGLFYAAYHGLGLNGPVGSNADKALSIVLASAFRFFGYRTWVFQRDARRAA